MPTREIVLYPDSRLRQPCAPVKEINAEILALVEDMADTMYAAQGIGLAAPQIGELLRVVVIDIREDDKSDDQSRLYKLINPEIKARDGEIDSEEGCLSIPEFRETIKRAENVVVDAVDESGKSISIEAGGLLAVCLQHEIDHLDGILFIDRLSRLKQQLIKPKLRKMFPPQESG